MTTVNDKKDPLAYTEGRINFAGNAG